MHHGHCVNEEKQFSPGRADMMVSQIQLLSRLLEHVTLYKACEAAALMHRPSVHAGNVVQSLSFSSVVPLTIWAFTFDWPLLDPAPALGSKFVLGTGETTAEQRMCGVLMLSLLLVRADVP